jgi:hypothetical protein
MEGARSSGRGRCRSAPGDKYFVFLDGDYLGNLLVEHFRLPNGRDCTEVGPVRVTGERLEA